MEYLNIHTSALDSEAMQFAEPLDHSTWLFLLRFCAGQENSGRIKGARKWADSVWPRLIRVSKEQVTRETGLWTWDGEDLVVTFYPVDQQREMIRKRNGAKAGGRLRGEQLKAQAKARLQPEAKPMAEPEAEPEAKRKEREGKERECNEMEEPALFAQIPSLEEVTDWAKGAAGVDPSYAEMQWRKHNEDNAWVRNGQLIRWRDKFKRYWESDRERWLKNLKKNGAALARKEGDRDYWFTEDLEDLEGELYGAQSSGQLEIAARLREIIAARGGTI